MSRLTKRLGDQVIIKDIGITDCKKVCDSMNEYDNPCDMCIIDEVFRRLAYFEDLEEQGRLIEQKHGRWIDNHCTVCGMMPMGEEIWNNCDFTPPRFEMFMDYCPNCGAKMDEVEK